MHYGILGPVEIWVGSRVFSVDRPLRRAVLVYLLLHPNRVVSLDQLEEALWGGATPASARAQIRSAVSRIRQALRAAGLADALTTYAAGYSFAVPPEALDLDVFRARATRARELAEKDRHAEASEALREGMLLWRGPALSGATAAFVDAAGARLDDERLAAYEDLMEYQLALDRHAEVLAELHALADTHPLRERLSAQLMVALYRSGRQADALAAFDRLRKRLADQLGVDPGPEVRQRFEAIVRADPTLDRPRRPPAAPAPPAQLPPPVADFTGRSPELAALDALVCDDPAADAAVGALVVTAIAGTAGVGKTALAVHWGHRRRHRFPDGQLFINLRGHAPAAPVPPIEALGQALRALHVPTGQLPLDLDEAVALYRSATAGLRMLVLVDNAVSAEQIRPLLAGGSGSCVLVTSRDRLDGLLARDGARRITVDVLPPADAVALLARIVGADRVAAEPAAAAGLAQACAYLPLALRITAAYLAGQPHRTLAGHLADVRADPQLAVLELANDEQSAVRAAFDLSYGALSAEEQRVFRLLGVVPGHDVTTEAVAALATIPAARAAHLLDRLASVHLIDQHAPGRFGCHDLLRRYAASLAGRDDGSAAALARLVGWYLHSTEAATDLLQDQLVRLPLPAGDRIEPASFPSAAAALAWLDAERANLVAAVRHTAANGPRELCILLAYSLGRYFQQGTHVVDWLAASTAAAGAAEAEADPRLRAAAELNVARAYSFAARYPEAAERYASALALARETGWPETEAVALSNLGNICQELGRLTEAAEHHRDTRELAQRIGSTIGEAAALNNLGLVYHIMGRLEPARRCLEEALRLQLPNRYEAFAANARATLAAITRDLGALPEALGLARTALADAQAASNSRTEADVLNIIGTIHQLLSQHEQADDHHERALRLARQTGNSQPEIEALVGLATAYRHRGDFRRSISLAQEAGDAARQVGYRQAEGQALTALAEAQLATGDGEAARRNAEQAAHLHRTSGHRLDEARALVTLGHAYVVTAAPAAGQRCWQEAAELFAAAGSPRAEPTRELYHQATAA